jgi:hypothetical protein
MTSNIEPRARAVCERDLRRAGTPEINLAADVDRYWHCVAAQIGSGLIDDTDELVPHELGAGLAAYRDWCARHPASIGANR